MISIQMVEDIIYSLGFEKKQLVGEYRWLHRNTQIQLYAQ
jgi:hypothetical protein